ncbi:MAG: hypothetical protein IPM29_29100 [Planctomycetes bacterium]|nr:hypothetical protein [Planctomycetota bacterium]
MRWPESLAPLCDALAAEARALDALRLDLVARRRDFAAARPSTVSRAVEDLEPPLRAIEHAAAERARHASATCRALGLPEGTPARLLAARLDAPSARRLLDAAETARAAAGRLRVENAVGADLLDLSARVQEGIWERLVETGDSSPSLYDARSHTVKSERPHGRFVDGLL